MAERKAGWYWVKTDFQNKWEAAEFDGDDWHVTRADHEWSESMLDEIGQRIPEPDELWKLVPTIPNEDMKHCLEAGTCWESRWFGMLASTPQP